MPCKSDAEEVESGDLRQQATLSPFGSAFAGMGVLLAVSPFVLTH